MAMKRPVRPSGTWLPTLPFLRSTARRRRLLRRSRWGAVALTGSLLIGLGHGTAVGANGRWGAVVYVNTPPGYALNNRWGPGTEFGIYTKTRRGCPLELSGISRRGWLQLTNGTWVASNWVTSAPRERIACISTPTAQTVAIVNTPAGYALNIRRGPGTQYALVGQYVHGSRLPFTGRFQNGWTELVDGTWVDSNFLTFSPGQGPPTPPPQPPTPIVDPVIQDAQRRLKQIGYLPPNFPLSGTYDAETQAAIRTFQRVNGLQETGRMDAATWQALYNATAPQPPSGIRQMRVNAGDQDYAVAHAGPGPEYAEVTRYRNGAIVTTTGRVTGNWTEIQGNMWIFTQWLQAL